MEFLYRRNDLIFKRPAGTSRGILHTKPTWFIDVSYGGKRGQGEVSLIPGLSLEDEQRVDGMLADVGQKISQPEASERVAEFLATPLLDYSLNDYREKLAACSHLLDQLDIYPDGSAPAIRFGVELALLDLVGGGRGNYFSSAFTIGMAKIPINGLIWMGDVDYMHEQIEAKLAEGFSCLKLKIGAIDFDAECAILDAIRARFSYDVLEVRVDANGAFSPHDVDEKLKRLSIYNLHSIEQPIRAGQWREMAHLCQNPPLPIALDEELIGVAPHLHGEMLDTIKPQYIILKPSLLGGFYFANRWIAESEARGIGYWATSALESNLGLAAIAQWTALYQPSMPQGLGTGKLYTNNLPSNLCIENGYLQVDGSRG